MVFSAEQLHQLESLFDKRFENRIEERLARTVT